MVFKLNEATSAHFIKENKIIQFFIDFKENCIFWKNFLSKVTSKQFVNG